VDVRLAGYNLDRDLILAIRAALGRIASLPAGLSADVDAARAEAGELLARDNWTPETLSAAYARISRDPRPVTELRAVAREEVDAARRSNETIIFGLGHASVAEHAVFNLDILGVSRLAVEEIERMRLCSYTEKSQRYILLDEDFVVPEEMAVVGMAGEFRDLLCEQNAFYRSAYEHLLPWVFDTYAELATQKKNHRTLEGLAKEDARYGLSLATTVQLGETINARNLEALIARTAAHPLAELQAFSRRLYGAVAGIAPSVIKYVEPTPARVETPRELAELVGRIAGATAGAAPGRAEAAPGGAGATPGATPLAAPGTPDEAVAIDIPADAEIRIVAAILHTYGALNARACRARADAMGPQGRAEILRAAFHHLGPHDPVLREFEHAHVVFEVVLSAACFGQLKRHRMATLTTQAYDPRLGVTIPPSFEPTGLVTPFTALRERTEAMHARALERTTAGVAAYILLNAHRRRALWGMNVRELYHVARLRLDQHAQWDIRRLSERVIDLARERMPGLLLLACGKDRFAERRAEIFGSEE
jgi:flavin-dependent thymidylate synthase